MKRIIRIGKNKHNPEIEYYVDKIDSLEVIHVKDDKSTNKELVKKNEGKRILEKVIGYTVALTEEGAQMDSITFAQLIEKQPDITFIIGGAYGLSDEVKKKAVLLLSLSKMTFPHELAYLMLVEQLYRAERILEGHPYHKE